MAIFAVTNVNDSGAGSLRQAILDSNAAGGNNGIIFDPSLTGLEITILTPLPVTTNTAINADIDGDIISDITIVTDINEPLFILDSDGTVLENSYGTINYDIDESFGIADSFVGAIRVTGDDASFINSGALNVSGTFGPDFDRATAVYVQGDDFTLNNTIDGSIVTTGRFGINAISFDDDFVIEDIFTTVINEGYIEAGDDAIRLSIGSVLNTGFIVSTGTYDLDFTGDAFTPGFASDGISIVGQQEASAVEPLVSSVDNSGSVEGYRAGIILSGGGVITNSGLVEGQVNAILAQGSFIDASTVNLAINNSGTLTRSGGNFGLGVTEVQSNAYAAVYIGSNLDNATILNSGTINSTDVAIAAAFSGATFINEATGVINSNTDGIDADGIGDDGLAFYGAALEFFEVLVSVETFFAEPNQILENTQGITVNSNGNFVVPGVVGTLLPSNFGHEAAFVGAGNPILPLVDLAATQAAGFLVFQTDANGLVYPATIDVTSSTLGILTVNFVSGSGFTVTDVNGATAYAVPDGVDFSDTITNAGQINGDIATGLDDDTVTNTGVIDGDISLGRGDDTFTSTGANGGLNFNIDGGAGNDTIRSGENNDTIDGGSGDDFFSGGAGDDSIFGGDGDDRAFGGADNDLINGDAGDDDLRGGTGDDVINGGEGVDLLVGSAGNDTLNGDNGVDRLIGGADDDTLNGGAGNDTLLAQSGDDTINGGDGEDIITGQFGNDTINGDAGNDNIFAGFGEDLVFGGTGDDTIRGEGQDDELHGGDGTDTITGGGGRDTIFGDAGNDTIFGQGGLDTIQGGGGDDTIGGGDGNDVMRGQGGNDTLNGGNGHDEIFGNSGDDILNGNAGNDILNGGFGNDILNGGSGDDIFVFGAGFEGDTINGFRNDEDTLNFFNSSLGVSSIAELLDPANGYVSQTDANTVTFDFGNGDILTVNGSSAFTIDDLVDDVLLG